MNLVKPHSFFSDFDINLFKSGKHYKLYEKMGAHLCERDGEQGVYFAVWAPNAYKVCVIGDFNFWAGNQHELYVRWDQSGIWEGFIPGVKAGTAYKYKIYSNTGNQVLEKIDPYAFYCEQPPRTASIVWDLAFHWNDRKWMDSRAAKNALDQPWSVYELHLTSWKKKIEENRSLTYDELAQDLVAYIAYMGYTHVELMPVMEHPYDPSWGYQVTGYFAPTSRFGVPQGFMHLVDELHKADIGVILDWVPAHFPSDAHALANYDGTNLYEHPDPRKGYHPDWKSLIFNFERFEVRSFLISSALFWLDVYHADGLRVDAVASMLYLDYSRNDGEWEPNEQGGRENLAAISFIREFNDAIYSHFSGVQTIAEESTAFPMISKPVWLGGLGFGMKWMMGWMNDTLEYFKRDPVYRKFHQHNITFSLTYAFTENFMLPFSHDEVVHGKRSLLNKMPGDEWQKFANLRVMLAYMWTHPGAKLLFMGDDFGQSAEWNFQTSLDWHLLQYAPHKGVQTLVRELNRLYRTEPALYKFAFHLNGYEWIDFRDGANSLLSYIRKSDRLEDTLLVVVNLTPVTHEKYPIGAPQQGDWEVIFSSDDPVYWGSGFRLKKVYATTDAEIHNRPQSIKMDIPPLAAVILKRKSNPETEINHHGTVQL